MAERSVTSGDESRRAVAEQAMRVREEVQKESAGLIERIGKLEVELQSVCAHTHTHAHSRTRMHVRARVHTRTHNPTQRTHA